MRGEGRVPCRAAQVHGSETGSSVVDTKGAEGCAVRDAKKVVGGYTVWLLLCCKAARALAR